MTARISSKTNRKSADNASPLSFAGQQAASLTPPSYGIDYVDSGASSGTPVQCYTASASAPIPTTGVPTHSATGMPDHLRSGVESLSGVDMSNVRVHSNSDKPAQIGAFAYAQGSDIYLGHGQEQHLPHEAWHVAQQRQGRVSATTQAKGVAINQDTALEHEADTMGDKAARMQRAAPAHTNLHASTVSSTASVIQGYFKQSYGADNNWLQADDLTVVTQEKESDPNHRLYAKAGKVAEANKKLAAVKSGIELIETATKYRFSEGDDKKRPTVLNKVEPRNKENKTSGNNMQLYADCGRSNAVVVGSSDRQSVYDKPGKPGTKATAAVSSPAMMKTAIAKAWLKDEGFTINLVKAVRVRSARKSAESKESVLEKLATEYGNAKTDPEREGIRTRYMAQLDIIAEAYWGYYNQLTDTERDDVDKALKINRYATPDVGQGYTISSGGASAGKATWNFHWGGVVMESDDGKDKVVLENYAVGDPKVENDKWTFDIYGTEKKDQTFHERHQATQQHGLSPTTMTIEKKP